ncbi:MAG: GntR family transcriptional regulator [Candidatus Eremiobacteraeota bacterium]|nr:GntR family transcriptional regulator [Candidatus Eremiobacteraeota bacterium]
MQKQIQPQTLERASTSKRVAGYLRERIEQGTIEPGERLNELALAGELGVSRSPIREALAQLAGEGLVRVVPYKGTFVTALSAERLQDLLDFRLALEQFAVRRSLEHAGPDEFQHFETLVDRIEACAKSADLVAAVDADLATHEYLIAMAGNALLGETYRSMLGELRLYIAQTSRHYENAADLATEHRALLAAMRAGKTEDAVALIAAHITHGFNRAIEETK